MAKVPRSLAGSVVAITGGARGIGRATAAALIAQGARVAFGDIEAQLAEQTAAELGAGTIGLPLDVTERDSFARFLDEVEQRLGPLDVLINNAGIMPVGPFVEETDATAKRMVDINVHGVIFGSKLAVERFIPAHAREATSAAAAHHRVREAAELAQLAPIARAQTLDIAWELPMDSGVRPIAFEHGPTGRIFVQLSGLHGSAAVEAG